MSSGKKKSQNRYNISITGKPCVVCIGAGLEQSQSGLSGVSLESLNLPSLGKPTDKKKNKSKDELKKYRKEIQRLQAEKEHYRNELIKSHRSETKTHNKQYLDAAFESMFPKRLLKKMSKKEVKRLKKLFKKEFVAQLSERAAEVQPESQQYFGKDFEVLPRHNNDYDALDDFDDDLPDEPKAETEENHAVVRPLARTKKKSFNASLYAPQGGKYYLDKNRAIEVSVYTKPNDKEKEILDYLAKHPSATQIELANVMALSRSTIADYTSTLKNKGLLHREGTRRSGRWVVSSH